MKIIGISQRVNWDNYEYVCTVSSNEMSALLDKDYRDGRKLEVGSEVHVEGLADRLKEIKRTKETLSETPKKLRELANALEHECAGLTEPKEMS